jgi:hypothetical protein
MEDDHLNFLHVQVQEFFVGSQRHMETVGKQTIRSQGSSKKDAKARFCQDESAFEAFAMYAKAWKVDGIQEERDKDDGPV